MIGCRRKSERVEEKEDAEEKRNRREQLELAGSWSQPYYHGTLQREGEGCTGEKYPIRKMVEARIGNVMSTMGRVKRREKNIGKKN